LNSYKDKGVVAYAVRDFESGSELEIITEEELKLLISLNLVMKDMKGNTVTLTGDTLNLDVDDITELVNEDDSSEEDDYADDLYYFDEDESDEEIEEDEDDDEAFYDYDDFEEEIIEDEEPEGSVVSKLYEQLNEEQIRTLKRYYLWYSQRLFTDAQKDPTLGLKDKNKIKAKKNALNQLRGDGEWRYAGFLDTGSRDAGYTCTLGHPLRYMHLAWDITKGDIETCFFGENYNKDFESVINSNDCIIYGIKCIGDFFEVNADCISNLQRAQRESLRDMAIIYEFYQNNQVETALGSYDFMDEVVKNINKKDLKGKILGDNYKPIIPYSMAAFYMQFREQKMIPPKSLIQGIRNCIVGWTDGTVYFQSKWAGVLHYPEDSFISNVIPTALKFKKVDEHLLDDFNIGVIKRCLYPTCFADFILHYVYVAFTYEICGIYKYDAETNKDEGGRSKGVKQTLKTHYVYNTQSIFSDFNYSLDFCNKLIRINNILKDFKNSYYIKNFPISVVPSEDTATAIGLYLSNISNDRVIDVIKDFDKEYDTNLYDIMLLFSNLNSAFNRARYKPHSPFTSVLYSARTEDDGKFNLDDVYTVVSENYTKFLELYEKLKAFLEERNQSYIDTYNRNLAEAERIKEEERQRILEEERLEQERQEELKKKTSDIDTPKKLIEYIKEHKSDKSLGSAFKLSLDILDTVVTSGKEPSNRQLYHLKKLYKELSGVEYTGIGAEENSRIELANRKDLKDAIDYILANKNLISECITHLSKNVTSDEKKFEDILNSIVKFGKISERQMYYAEAAKAVYDLKGM
jgi:hypothetical protein